MPGFDKVFLTPLATVLVAIVDGLIIGHSRPWQSAVASCVIAAVWPVLFGGGPTLQTWLLTGQHRFTPPTRLGGTSHLIQPI